jgi:hypothetical protein
MTMRNYDFGRPKSCQCATSNPPCSFCTDTVPCEACGEKWYPDELIESDSIAGVAVEPKHLCPNCGAEVDYE